MLLIITTRLVYTAQPIQFQKSNESGQLVNTGMKEKLWSRYEWTELAGHCGQRHKVYVIREGKLSFA